MMRTLSIFGMLTVLMQAQTESGGCLQDFGLFPGLFGGGTIGVGVGSALNTAPPVDPGDLVNPPVIPGDGMDPTDPTDPNTPVDPTAPVMMVLENEGVGELLVEFLIDGALRQYDLQGLERCMVDLGRCVQDIDLQRVIVLTSLGTPDPGTIDLFDLPELDLTGDTSLDWPGASGSLVCGDTIQYQFNLLNTPVTSKFTVADPSGGSLPACIRVP